MLIPPAYFPRNSRCRKRQPRVPYRHFRPPVITHPDVTSKALSCVAFCASFHLKSLKALRLDVARVEIKLVKLKAGRSRRSAAEACPVGRGPASQVERGISLAIASGWAPLPAAPKLKICRRTRFGFAG